MMVLFVVVCIMSFLIVHKYVTIIFKIIVVGTCQKYIYGYPYIYKYFYQGYNQGIENT